MCHFKWIGSTALQGDAGLAAAPFTPGALMVSDSNLGEILSPVEEATLVHSFGLSNPTQQDLTCVPGERNHTDVTPDMYITMTVTR